jgi:hypothetical protein
MSNPALALLAGFGGGYVQGSQRKIENDRAAAADQRAQDIHDLQMRSAQRDQDLQVKLANAARPAQVDLGAGGFTKPETADNIDVGQPGEPGADAGGLQQGPLVNGKSFANAGDAQAAATAYDDPNAVTLRQAQAYQQAGKPAEAMALQKGAFHFTKEQQEVARKLKQEGILDAAEAARRGDPQAVFDAFNGQGKVKFVGVPTVTPEDRELPGFGTVKTYTYTGKILGADGEVHDWSMNSHDLSMRTMPYEKALDLQLKGQRNEDMADYRDQLVDVKGKLADVASKVADQKIKDADRRQNTTLTEAERKRWTATMNAASSNLRTAEKALGDFQKDKLNQRSLTKNPNGPEAQQLAQLQSAVKKHSDDYNDARSRLAAAPSGSAPVAAPGAAPTNKAQPLPAAKGDLKVGQTYQTTRGPATWNGTAFEQ